MNQSPIRGRTVAILVGICALAMLALAVLYAFAPDLRGNDSDQANALSRSAVGFAGLIELLDDSGIPTRIDRGDRGKTNPSLTILTPGEFTSPADLAAYRAQGPVLVILPKWETVPLRTHPGWVQKYDFVDVKTINALVAPITQRAGLNRSTFGPRSKDTGLLSPMDHIQILTGGTDKRTVVVTRGYEALLWQSRRNGNLLTILADPDLANNRALADEKRANAIVEIIRNLRAGNGPVLLDITLNGLGRSPNLFRAAFAPPFLGATLCALFAALLMGLHTAFRFGAPLVPPRIFARGKKALADNSAQLVRMMGREGAMAPRYVAATRTLVLDAISARRAAPAQQQALLDTLSGGGETYESLAAEAAGAKTGNDLLAVARKTFDWRRRISGGH